MSVLLTASLAPIIGFNTAMGTARITARTGPCWDGERKKILLGLEETYLVARTFIHFHRDRKDCLSGGV